MFLRVFQLKLNFTSLRSLYVVQDAWQFPSSQISDFLWYLRCHALIVNSGYMLKLSELLQAFSLLPVGLKIADLILNLRRKWVSVHFIPITSFPSRLPRRKQTNPICISFTQPKPANEYFPPFFPFPSSSASHYRSTRSRWSDMRSQKRERINRINKFEGKKFKKITRGNRFFFDRKSSANFYRNRVLCWSKFSFSLGSKLTLLQNNLSEKKKLKAFSCANFSVVNIHNPSSVHFN